MPAIEKTYFGSPEDPKTAAIVCYITIIGWFVAYFALYRNKKTALAAYHLRQTLLLYIVFILVNGLRYWTNNGFVLLFNVIWFILWLWGFFRAVYEQQKPIPVIGKLAQKLFEGL